MKNNEKKLVPKLRFPEFQNRDEWTEKKFDDLCKFIRGPFGGALKKEIFVSEGYAVYEQQHAIYGDFSTFRYFISEEKFNEMKRFSVLPKDIIMSCSGTMGKFAVVPEKPKEGVINQALLKLTVKSGYEIGFIKTTLELPVNQNKLLSQSAGGAIKNVVEVAQIKEIKLLIPPIKEQQKIASCLSSLDEVITAESQKLDVLKEHKKGLLQNLFPQEGEKVPKLRFKEFEESGEWKEMTLGEICKVTSGGTPSRTNNDYWNGDIPWISTTLIDFNTINSANEYITKAGLQNSSAKIFPKDTILMAMYGQGKTRGKVAILGNEAATNQACAAILLKDGYNTNYVFQNLAGRYDEIRKFSNQGGQENLSGGLIENISITIPVNPKEQQKIAACLSSLDDLINTQSQKIETLKLHKKGLLQGLFPNACRVSH